MATVKEIKAFLKESGLKESDIDRMWTEAITGNTLLQNLERQGIGWKKLPVHLIKQLPDEKENQIKRVEQKRQEEENKKSEMDKIMQEKEEYEKIWNDTDLFIKLFDNPKFIEHELQRIVCEDSPAELVTEMPGNLRRWTQTIETIVKLKDRYFLIHWERGLTDNNPNEYNIQPVEVVRKERQVVEVYWEIV